MEPIKPEPIKPEPKPITVLIRIPEPVQEAIKLLVIIPGENPLPVPLNQKEIVVSIKEGVEVTVKNLDKNNYCIAEKPCTLVKM